MSSQHPKEETQERTTSLPNGCSYARARNSARIAIKIECGLLARTSPGNASNNRSWFRRMLDNILITFWFLISLWVTEFSWKFLFSGSLFRTHIYQLCSVSTGHVNSFQSKTSILYVYPNIHCSTNARVVLSCDETHEIWDGLKWKMVA